MAEQVSTALATISQKKQSRASKPKVRTGCQTCKRRKVKCDETKPRCTRCARADLECDGYGIFIDVRSRNGFTTLHTAPTAQKVPLLSDTFIFYRGLNALSELTELENASYDFARQCTVSDLSSLQCVHFWSSSVMSGCHSDPAILHAVLALGAAHRSHVLAHSTTGPSNAGSFSSVAYSHYGKAIKHLQTRVSLEGAENCRIVLIACIVLLSFDMLEARYAPALVHLHHGRRILKLQYGLKATTAASNLLYLPPQTRTVDEELVYSFGQIDLQAMNFGGGKPQFTFVDHPDKLGPNEHVVPDAFTSIEDAGRYIMILMNDCWRLIGLLPDNMKLNYTNAEAVNHRFRLLASCERWEHAFHAANFPHSSAESARDPDYRKAIILQMHHALITIKTSVCMSYPDEMGYDSLLPYYSKIISLASGLFPNLPIFNIDTAIIHPLFSAATHCRHPVMRRKAVDILRRSGREGLWDSRMLVLVAEEVIQHEEGHAGYCYDDQISLPADLQLADIIPCQSRIAQSWVFFADETQKILRTIHKRPKWSRIQQYPQKSSNVNEDEDAWEVMEKCTLLGDE